MVKEKYTTTTDEIGKIQIYKSMDFSREEANRIANKVRKMILVSVGEATWKELFEQIINNFKTEREKYLGCLVLGEAIGREEVKKEMLKSMSEGLSKLPELTARMVEGLECSEKYY